MPKMVAYKSTSVKRRVACWLNDDRQHLAYHSIMVRVVEIHRGKQPVRIHYIAEWAAKRGHSQADIARELGVDKGTVSKWFSGKLPQEANLLPLAAMLGTEPDRLFRHPDDDWIANFFQGRSEEERNRMVKTLEAAFPPVDKAS